MHFVISREENPEDRWSYREKKARIWLKKWWKSSRCSLFSGGLSAGGLPVELDELAGQVTKGEARSACGLDLDLFGNDAGMKARASDTRSS